jgi:DNA-binding transcriptional regulator YiaG
LIACDPFVIAYKPGVTPAVAQPNNLPNISMRLFRDVIAIVSYTPPMSPLLEDAQRVHDTAGLSDRMIAAATGAKPSTVRGWLAGRSEPTGARAERLIELAEMIKRLALVLRPESIPVWLQRPILALDDEKPIELIARGEYRRVAKLIAEIEYPGIS